MAKFNYDQDFEHTDFRQHPDRYQVGKGEQGVLLVEPYKSEILPHWRFKTPDIARQSADTIYELFLSYKEQDDFVGMDMARKFLQMGFTRARRYANHKNGRKYDAEGNELPREEDPVKAESAAIFYEKYVLARNDPDYQRLKKAHQAKYG
ncbi:MAG: cytoplasmic protein [Anaerolineaceae bacterium]|nr:cytoplasmic protein [Anaerolineaceae bacterium]